MKQLSVARGGFDRYSKTTKRVAFLAGMDRVVPWSQLCALIEPHYPKAVAVATQWDWSACCASTSCSIGS
jgi:hypothetical protein